MAQGDSSAWMHLRVLFLFFGVSRSLQRPPFLLGESPQTAGESRDPSLTRRKKNPVSCVCFKAFRPFHLCLDVGAAGSTPSLCFFFFFLSQHGFFFSLSDGGRCLLALRWDFSLRHERLRLGTSPTAGGLKHDGRRFTLWLFFFFSFLFFPYRSAETSESQHRR